MRRQRQKAVSTLLTGVLSVARSCSEFRLYVCRLDWLQDEIDAAFGRPSQSSHRGPIFKRLLVQRPSYERVNFFTLFRKVFIAIIPHKGSLLKVPMAIVTESGDWVKQNLLDLRPCLDFEPVTPRTLYLCSTESSGVFRWFKLFINGG